MIKFLKDIVYTDLYKYSIIYCVRSYKLADMFLYCDRPYSIFEIADFLGLTYYDIRDISSECLACIINV